MKALTIRQPWASLIALGVKTIETRSWKAPDTLIGERIAIHAAKRRPSPCWVRLGDYVLGHEPYDGSIDLVHRPNGSMVPLAVYALPLGAVVATARLAACCPIGGPYSFSTGLVEGERSPTAGTDVIVDHGSSFLGSRLILDRWDDRNEIIDDQLPYGDFTPGRWAWMLEDVEPRRKPLPWKGQQGIWNIPHRDDEEGT